MRKDPAEDHAAILGIAIVWWLLALFIILATAGVFVYTRPWFTAKETANLRQSDQYITSKQSALRELKTNYDVLSVRLSDLRKDADANESLIRDVIAQQRGIVRQMREQADLIPGHVQDDIREFLTSQQEK